MVEKPGGPLVIKDLPHRELQPHEVLIRVEACGCCHSDTLAVLGHWPGITYPRVPGHELVGIIEKIGSAVPASRGLNVGQRVGRGWHGGHCFGCRSCFKGDFVLCAQHNVTGITCDGGYAEYNYAPWESLAVVPDDLDPAEAGPLMCAGVTVFNGLRQLRIVPPATVAVLGIGGLGHLAIQFAAKMGYTVAAISSSSAKEQLAKELGATYYIDSSKGNAGEQLKALGGASAIIATAFSAKAMQETYIGLTTDGVLLVLGVDMEPISISTLQLIGNRGSVHGHPSGSAVDSQDTLEFAKQFNISSRVETYPLEKAQEAYDAMLKGTPKFRAVIKLV